MERMIFLQFLVAMCMSLAAICFFLWATLAGQFKDGESIKYDMLERELGNASGGGRERS